MATVGAEDTKAANTKTFVTALVTGLIVGTVYLSLFYVLHGRNQKVFQPKSYLGPPQKRVEALPLNPIAWFRGIWSAPDSRVAEVNGLDAYFFVRFIKAMIYLLLPAWLLTWVVLMPVTAIKPNNGRPGLDIFSIGNVGPEARLTAHVIVALIIIFWTLFVLYREFMHWASIRIAYISSAAYAADPRSRSVMLTNLPAAATESEESLRQFIGAPTPENVWLVRKIKPLEKLVKDRDDEVFRLEGAVTKVETLAAKNVRKQTLPPGADPEDQDLIARYVLDKKRPAHKTGFLGLIGKKHDTLDDTPLIVREKNDDIERERRKIDTFPLANTGFARFASQADAHAFALSVALHTANLPRTVRVYTDVVPEDVIWTNLSMSPAQRLIRTIVSWSITVGLIIMWLPLVAFVGVVSNIQTICSTVSWLNWICKLPAVVVGIIQGVLPPVALAILFMLLPIFLRLLIKLQGEPRYSTVERKLWNRFWVFQIIHGFLIVGAASGLLETLTKINSDTIANLPTDLAKRLPSSSIFFLTFILTATLGGATKTFSRAVPFIMGKLAFILRSNVPRKAFKYDYSMGATALSTTWPPVALLAVMATVYMVVQPIIVGFACCGFVLLYLTYKYMLIWVCEQPTHLETNGFYYPFALGAVFAGLYVEEIFLAALFILRKTTAGYVCGGIIAATILVTIVFQFWIDRRARSIATYLNSPAGKDFNDSKERLTVHPPPLRPLEVADDAGPNAFTHPAVYKAQPVVWIADDSLGLGNLMRTRIGESGVLVSTDGANMGEDGKTEVTRGPPDGPWYGDEDAKGERKDTRQEAERGAAAAAAVEGAAPVAGSAA